MVNRAAIDYHIVLHLHSIDNIIFVQYIQMYAVIDEQNLSNQNHDYVIAVLSCHCYYIIIL